MGSERAQNMKKKKFGVRVGYAKDEAEQELKRDEEEGEKGKKINNESPIDQSPSQSKEKEVGPENVSVNTKRSSSQNKRNR